MLYDNSNEERGINGYKRDIIEKWNRVYEKQKQQQNGHYSQKKYNKWEQSIKTISKINITNKSTKIKIISQNRSTSVNAFSTSLTKFNTHKILAITV